MTDLPAPDPTVATSPAVSAPAGAPPQMSPDGRFWWNGAYWMPLQQGPTYGYPAVVLAAKSPGLHLLASFFIPGLGSMLAGRVKRGLLILCGTVGIYISMFALTLAAAGPFPSCTYSSVSTSTGTRTISTCSPVATSAAPGWIWIIPVAMLCVFGLWIFGLVDGYRSAQAWNRERGILS